MNEVMVTSVMSIINKMDNPSVDINNKEFIEGTILKAYLATFKHNYKELSVGDKKFTRNHRNSLVPSCKEVLIKIDYEFDTKAYDLAGLSKAMFTEEKIAEVLQRHNCVYRWCGVVCNNAQMIMFELDKDQDLL